MANRVIGPPGRRDTYAEAWQAPTQWKTGIPGRLRIFLRPKTKKKDRSHSPPKSQTRSPQFPPELPASNRDKPLPPLPTESPAREDVPKRKDSSNESSRPKYKQKKFSSMLLFHREPQTHETEIPTEAHTIDLDREKDSPSTDETRTPMQYGYMTNNSSIESVLASPASYLVSAYIVPTAARGTQTSPRLLPFRSNPQMETRPAATPRKVWFANPHSPRSHPTVGSLIGRSTPEANSSPQRFGMVVKSQPVDYFSIPSDSDGSVTTLASLSSKSSTSTSKGSILKNTRYSMPALKGPSGRSGGSTSGGSDESLSSIGSYESRYEPRSPGDPKKDGDFQLRPYMPGVEPVLLDDGLRTTKVKFAFMKSPSVYVGGVTAGSAKSNVPQTIPIPFTKFSSFSAARTKKKRTSSTEVRSPSTSLLSQELKLPDRQLHAELGGGPSTPGFFDRPLSTPDPSTEIEHFIPEHLTGSPLCPAHPKYRGKVIDICPWHGRPTSTSTPSSTSSTTGFPSPHHTTTMPILRRSSDGAVDEDSLDGFVQTRQKILFDHPAISSACPANQGPRAVCIYHGEGRRVLATDSEESVPRKRLISV